VVALLCASLEELGRLLSVGGVGGGGLVAVGPRLQGARRGQAAGQRLAVVGSPGVLGGSVELVLVRGDVVGGGVVAGAGGVAVRVLIDGVIKDAAAQWGSRYDLTIE
jgi:hypothetical protein